MYDDLLIDNGLRLDVLVANTIVCELKAAETSHPVWLAQILSYLRLTDKKLGFLINFNVPVIKKGIKRVVCS